MAPLSFHHNEIRKDSLLQSCMRIYGGTGNYQNEKAAISRKWIQSALHMNE